MTIATATTADIDIIDIIAAEPAIPVGARMTVAEFQELPRTVMRYELIDGVVCMAAFPIPDHQTLSLTLAIHLHRQIAEPGLGIVLQEVGVSLTGDTVVGPDLSIIRAHRAGIVGPRMIDDAPDIVVEVLSTNRRHDLVRKRALYQTAGIPEYWIVDGSANTLTILALGNDGIYYERAILTPADTLTTPLFPGFAIPLTQLFHHPSRPCR